MFTKEQNETIDQRGKAIQIIWGFSILAIPIGASILYLIKPPPRIVNTMGVIQLVGAVFCITYVLAFVLPVVLRKKGAANLRAKYQVRDELVGDESIVERDLFGNAWGVVAGAKVIGISMIQGAAFANLAMYHVDSGAISLILAIIGFVLLLTKFPVVSTMAQQTEDVIDAVNRSRL